MAFPAPYAETAADTFSYEDDWKEINPNQSPSSVHLSHDGQEAVLVGRIPWNKQRSAARYFLGFAYADTASPWELHRENPHPHPEHPQLRAYDISFSPEGPKVNPDTTPTANQLWRESPFWATDYSRAAYYQDVIATVRYKSYRYAFIEDEALDGIAGAEYFRNTVIDAEPTMDVLSADGVSQLFWAETSGTGPGTGQPFPAPIGVLLTKTNLMLKWYSVPWEYLSSDTDVFFPAKVMACVGKVNNATFANRPAGTLLMRPPRWVVKPWPGVFGDDLVSQLFQVDIEVPLEFFRPPLGAASPTVEGHNNMPFRGDGKFYLATRDGTTGGARLLESADFDTIFEHVGS